MKEDNEKFRKVIVSKFLDKLGNVELKDADILPAMEDYVNTGNREMFEEFRMFHDNKDIQDKIEWLEERRKQLEADKAELEEAIERDEAYIDEAVKEYKTYMEKYKEFFKDYTTWRKDIMEQLDGEKSVFGLTWGNIKNYIADKEKKGWNNKFLYVAIGEEFHKVIGVSIDEKGKLILAAATDPAYAFICDGPDKPYLNLQVRDKYNRTILWNDLF